MRYKTTDDLPLVLAVSDLARLLGIGMNSAYNLVRSGRVRSIRVGHQIRIPKSAVLDFLDIDWIRELTCRHAARIIVLWYVCVAVRR